MVRRWTSTIINVLPPPLSYLGAVVEVAVLYFKMNSSTLLHLYYPKSQLLFIFELSITVSHSFSTRILSFGLEREFSHQLRLPGLFAGRPLIRNAHSSSSEDVLTFTIFLNTVWVSRTAFCVLSTPRCTQMLGAIIDRSRYLSKWEICLTYKVGQYFTVVS